MENGLVFNIQRYSLQDGPGIRTTVFLKGCPLRCGWCHNPESQSPEPEVSFLENRCVRCGQCRSVCPVGEAVGHGAAAQCLRCGACADVCPTEARQVVGRRMTVGEVMTEVLKDRIFYDDSGGGVTFSGGEPLFQPRFLRALLAACREEGVHTAVDTSGFAPQEDLLALAPLVDLFLYDIKTLEDCRHREATGASNTTVIENLEALGRVHRAIWVRVPVVPGLNDRDEDLQAIARFAAAVPGVRRLSLLPYHSTGLHKAAGLGRPQQPPAAPVLSSEALGQMADRLRGFGLPIEIE